MNHMNDAKMQCSQMSQQQLLHYINVVSFQMLDAQLFLDSHPINEEAMKHFNYFRKLRQDALKEYEKKYGPLTLDTANPTVSFEWVETPWPWEGGFC